jgi:hypothetical protein
MKADKTKRQPKRQPKQPAVTPDEYDDESPDVSLPDPFQLPDFIRRPLHLPTAV